MQSLVKFCSYLKRTKKISPKDLERGGIIGLQKRGAEGMEVIDFLR